MDHKINRPRLRHEYNIQNIGRLGKMVSICNKQHLRNF